MLPFLWYRTMQHKLCVGCYAFFNIVSFYVSVSWKPTGGQQTEHNTSESAQKALLMCFLSVRYTVFLQVSISMALVFESVCHVVQAVKEVESLRAMVGNYDKDKAALTQSKARLLQSEKHLKHLEWENEVCSLSMVLPGFVEDMPCSVGLDKRQCKHLAVLSAADACREQFGVEVGCSAVDTVRVCMKVLSQLCHAWPHILRGGE